MKEPELLCPRCESRESVRYGKRKIKNQMVQLYRCQQCQGFFSDHQMKNKTYQANVILGGISFYNLGYSLAETRAQIARRFRIKVPNSTLHSWLVKYRDVCRYADLREKGKKLYSPKDIICSREFDHQQLYKFQYHRAKVDLQLMNQKRFQPLKKYLEWVAGEDDDSKGFHQSKFPHKLFAQPSKDAGQRASRARLRSFMPVQSTKNNLTNALAENGLKLAKTNYERHEHIQRFMLINDAVTVAAEVPVYLTNRDIKYLRDRGFQINFASAHTPITGHIDLIQIRNNLIYVLDYKPEAKQEKPFEQLTAYALALSARTKLPVKVFKCGWFDDRNYYEFFPLPLVYPKGAKKKYTR